MNKFDVVIIGAGPSGITAAIYLKRAGLSFAIIEKGMPGGKVGLTAKIENYPGFTSTEGVDLALNLASQLEFNKIDLTFDNIQSITKEDGLFVSQGEKETYYSSYVIVATGTKERGLDVEGEEKYYGRGISFCAICDGALYKGKDVAVIGGGNSALEEALYLSHIVNKVYLIHRRNEFRGDQILVDRVKDTENIIIYTPFVVDKIQGEETISALKIVSEDEEEWLNVEGIFVYIGLIPVIDFIKEDIENANGYIITDENMCSSIDGLYAVGDIRQKSLRQIVTAVNDGAIAAVSIEKRIHS